MVLNASSTTPSQENHVATTNDDEVVIGPNEAALVAEENGELRLILPEYDDDEDVPPMATSS